MAEQLDLLRPAEHLERVTSRIASSIVAFCEQHRTFFMDELRRHIIREVGMIAPGSANRVLRSLRQRKVVDYRCVSRAKSLYEVLSVPSSSGVAA